jgi:hypothetical protein
MHKLPRRGLQRELQRQRPSDHGEHRPGAACAFRQNITHVRALDGRQLARPK